MDATNGGTRKHRAQSADLADKMAKLTPKQRKLASLLGRGVLTKVEAFKQAYNSSQTGRNLYASASRAASHPKVQAVIMTYHHSEWEGSIADAREMRRLALRVMRDIAEDGVEERNRLKAAELLARTQAAGLYQSIGSLHQHVHVEGGSARETLMAKLSALLGPPQPVASGSSAMSSGRQESAKRAAKETPTPFNFE